MKKPYFQLEDFAACSSPGYLLRRVHNAMLRRAEEIVSLEELTFTQWIVLMQLREGIASTGAEICRNLNHDSGATTRLLDTLETRGLIERHRSQEDRRVSKLTLTAKGRAMAKMLTPRVVDFWNEITRDFSHTEISTMLGLLERLLARLEGDEQFGASDKTKGSK
ncbi:DNA-binding MarR family transcriptional regulator [Rhizomicrobium palustre]|uniref:DNA-binding MarR family transcriptional regulator n=1 Tax=Rhizomicrobium palustre TaxID=189966 RepID=A0A846MW35_9PROT|nr:MarR family transcriptional regulator [Rhizomicrobium palustre]NIK87439.1 DNA-binding MarR family transcriptional regulator [Rhizomicrobium palustre]